MPTSVALRKNLARALRDGHPWIFRDALDRPPRLPDGAVVDVRSRGGRPLATGFWDSRSAIAVRVLEAGPIGVVPAVVRSRLETAKRMRLSRLDLTRTNAFRWVHGEADRLPGLHVDLYDDVAAVRYDGDGARAFYAGLVDARVVIDRQRGRAPDLVVRENGLLFEVSPGAGGKGGLYLDQRENRQEVERRSRGRSVLNLFGYTGAFAMYAARGGAVRTDTVDIARPAIAAARRNFERNALPLDRAGFHVADAFEFLDQAARAGRRWDVVVSDPPSFAPNRGAVASAMRAYARLHRLAAAVVTRGGLLCAASCSSHVKRDEFLTTLRGLRVENVRGAAFDHPVAPWFPEGDYLKFAITAVP